MEPLRSGDPRRISSYEILNRLGAGGMGQVYLGRSPSGRRVAVKVIRPELTNDPTFRARFRREVATMRQVSGFFTAPVVDADPDGDPAWLATAFVPGPSLESAVAEGGAMPHQDVLLLAAGLAEALNAIHREGLTHRDLKPGNVLMAEDGPRVIDFGLAVTAEGSSGLTQAGTVVGTPAFMSPEQVSGKNVGPASDVWSLGAVLAYAATATSPFGDGGTMETMLRVMNGEPDLSGLTGTLAQLVAACMMKDPNARPTPARILQVLSEGAGVQATMAMDIEVPGREGAAASGAGADVGVSDTGMPSGQSAAVAAPSGGTHGSEVQGSEAQSSQAQPAWPTAESAAKAVSGAGPAAPSQNWGTAGASDPVSAPDSPTSGPAPAWGTGAASTPAPTSPPQAGPVSGPAPTPAPAWGTNPNPAPPSQPTAPAWGSGSGTGQAPNPATSQSSAPAWGTNPTPTPPPAWGSGQASAPHSGTSPAPTAPQQSWSNAPGPVSGPSTPPQAIPSMPSMPSMPSNQWPQTAGQQPYQGGPPTQAAQAASPWMQPQPQNSAPYSMPTPPAKKNRNGLIAAVGIAAVAVIGGGIAIFASSGGSGSSGGSTSGTSGGTLGGSGGLGSLTPIASDFQLSGLVTDADAAQYLKGTPTAGTPNSDTTDDPATFDKDWQGGSTNSELRVQASNYKADSAQAKTDFLNHTSTLATESPFEDQGKLGNSDKTEIQVATDQSSGLQHCKIEVIRGGLDVTITFVEPGSAAAAHTDVINLAKQVTSRLPGK